MPIVAATARRSGRPPILVAVPLLAGLSDHARYWSRPTPRPCWPRPITTRIWAAPFSGDWWLAFPPPPSPGRFWVPSSTAAGCAETRRRPWARMPRSPRRPFLPSCPPSLSRKAPNPFPRRPDRCWPASSSFSPSRSSSSAAGPMRSAPGAGLFNQILHFIGSPDIALLIAVAGCAASTRSAHPDRPSPWSRTIAQAHQRILRAHRQRHRDSLRGRRPQRRAARLGRGAGHGGSCHGCAHAPAGAGLAAGRRGTRLHGIGHRGHGRGLRRARAHGRHIPAFARNCWCWPPGPVR